MHKIISGDIDAFNEVFNLYHQKLYFYVLKKTQSHFCAEETVQETFIKLWKYRETLKPDLDISIQIFRIGKTVLIDHLRKENTSNNLIIQLQAHSGVSTSNAGPENLHRQEFSKKLYSILNLLPPVRRKVFEMSRFEELSHKEIASRLSISPKTVENHLNLSLKIIRKFFGPLLLLIKLL